ncbi:MAG: iron-regulated protein [Rhodospirillaceae bacterium]|nr:iron-regulated protein [Rhodospirillaceae bacterium]
MRRAGKVFITTMSRFAGPGLALMLAACSTGSESTTLDASLPDLTSYALIYTDAGARPAWRVSVDEAAEVLARFDVIFIGEAHQHPGNHLAEMALVRAIHARAPNLSLSMEQFERDVQPALDDYLAGRIGETPFAEKARAWSNYTTSYRPLVEYAKEHKLPVVAANAPEKFIRCIGREGTAFFTRLKPEQRAWVAAELNQADGPYKDKFLGFVGGDAGHGGEDSKDKAAPRKPPSETQLRSFVAQVTRDDTMAESIALHLANNAGRKVIHINGSFHSDSFLGTVERLKARMPKLKIAVVNPEFADNPMQLNVTVQEAKAGTFTLLLRQLPEFYATDEEITAAVKKQIEARNRNTCEF